VFGEDSATWAQKNVEQWRIADAMLHNYGKKVDDPMLVRAEQRKQRRSEHQSATDGSEEDERVSVYVCPDTNMEITVEKAFLELEERKREIRCWATLLAHCAGFAAIAAGGTLQQHSPFKHSPLLTLVPVAITTVLLHLVFQVTTLMRKRLQGEAKADKNRTGERVGMLVEACDEAEVDIVALMLSFLCVQSLRFALTGQLPNEEGAEEPLRFTVTMGHAYKIWACGAIFITLAVTFPSLAEKLLHKFSHRQHEEEAKEEEPLRSGANKEKEEEPSWLSKLIESIAGALAMSSAWCLMWGARYSWMASEVVNISVHKISARIILALLLSGVAVFVVIWLDKVADANESSTKVVGTIVAAVSLMVGFAWEHSFDGAVSDVAALSHDHPRTAKFCLGLVVVAVLLEPWQKYILKKVVQLEDLKKKRDSKSKLVKSDSETALLDQNH